MNTTLHKPEALMLARVLSSWREKGWRVWSEVSFEGLWIDAVAEKDESLLIAAQGKTQLDDAVIEQARLLQGVSDLTLIVVPWPNNLTPAHIDRVRHVEGMGLGLIYVGPGNSITERIKPAPNHDAQPDRLRAVLQQGQQTIGEAGSKGDRWSPDREWIENIRTELEEFGRFQVINAFHLQPIGRDRYSKGSVPRVILRMVSEGRLPFASVEQDGGKSWLVWRG